MSSRVDLKEFLGAYLAEVDEHLSFSNAKLLEIEASLKRNDSNPRAVRELFRLLHTIKGLSAMVGVDSVVTIAHSMEAVVRAADQQTTELGMPAMEPLFDGLRTIGELTRDLGQGKPVAEPPASLMERLEAIGAPEIPAASHEAETRDLILDLDPALDAKLAPFEREQLIRGTSDGRRSLRIDFVPSAKKAELGLTINSIRERVGSIAEIVKVVPLAIPVTPEAPGGLCFVLMILTLATDMELSAAVGETSADIHPLLVNAPRLPQVVAPVADEIEFVDDELHSRNVLRVDVRRVDDAMDRLAGLIVTRSRLTLALAEIGSVDLGGASTRELKVIIEEQGRQLRDLRAAILRIRTIRFAEILARLPLVVRGLRRTSGKEVAFFTEAGDAELDKAVAERIFPALLHLIRNAVDHGIEPPEERERLGKPREGRLIVQTSVRSNREIDIRVIDDGAGVDRAAVARQFGGEIPPFDQGLLDALCRAGLSTRAKATTGSGRGMGMDIVRKIVVDQLGGTLSLENRPGLGAIFTLRVPLTVAIVDAFVVRVEDESFVVPVVAVEDILEIDPKSTVRGATQNGPVTLMAWRGGTVPLVELAGIFGLRASGAPKISRHAMIVRRGNDPVAFALDRVLSQQEAVVRPLVDPLVQVAGISGSTDLGDGKATLVLDLGALANGLMTRERGEARVA